MGFIELPRQLLEVHPGHVGVHHSGEEVQPDRAHLASKLLDGGGGRGAVVLGLDHAGLAVDFSEPSILGKSDGGERYGERERRNELPLPRHSAPDRKDIHPRCTSP